MGPFLHWTSEQASLTQRLLFPAALQQERLPCSSIPVWCFPRIINRDRFVSWCEFETHANALFWCRFWMCASRSCHSVPCLEVKTNKLCCGILSVHNSLTCEFMIVKTIKVLLRVLHKYEADKDQITQYQTRGLLPERMIVVGLIFGHFYSHL